MKNFFTRLFTQRRFWSEINGLLRRGRRSDARSADINHLISQLCAHAQ